MRKPMVSMVVGAVGERLTWVLAVIVALGATAIAQQQPATDRFAAVAGLVGKWSGTSEGQPGNGTVEREYERVLGSRFIRVRNTSTYPPQAKNPKGERHEDEGFISFDGARKRLVFRQFHLEGFVNTYVQDLEAKTGTVVFVSEGIREHSSRLSRSRDLHLQRPERSRGGVRVGGACQGVRAVLAHKTQTSEIARPLRPKSARDRRLNRTDVERRTERRYGEADDQAA